MTRLGNTSWLLSVGSLKVSEKGIEVERTNEIVLLSTDSV
jgi:hypothetical protein